MLRSIKECQQKHSYPYILCSSSYKPTCTNCIISISVTTILLGIGQIHGKYTLTDCFITEAASHSSPPQNSQIHCRHKHSKTNPLNNYCPKVHYITGFMTYIKFHIRLSVCVIVYNNGKAITVRKE